MQKFLIKARNLAKSHDANGGTIFVRDDQIIAGGVTCVPDALAESQIEATSLEMAIGLSLRTGVSLEKSYCYTTTPLTQKDAVLLALIGVRMVVCTYCTPGFIEVCDSAKIDMEVSK